MATKTAADQSVSCSFLFYESCFYGHSPSEEYLWYKSYLPYTMFKILALIGVIYAVYRFQNLKQLNSSKEEDNGEEWVDYEEVD